MIVILAFRVSLVRIILFPKMGIYEPLEVACTYFISMSEVEAGGSWEFKVNLGYILRPCLP